MIGMMRFLLAAVLFVCAAPAMAQSSCEQGGPNIFQFGYMPTPGQWAQCLQSKQDSLGYNPINRAGDTMTGKLNLAPSSTTQAGLNCGGAGAAPTTPKDGDVWCTSAGMFTRVNGSTIGPFVSSGAPINSVTPVQAKPGAGYSFVAADIGFETLRSNSGSAMTDTLLPSGASGLVNGSPINILNADATAADTVSPGAGTTIMIGQATVSTIVVAPGIELRFVYDLAATAWRPVVNSNLALVPGSNVAVAYQNTLNGANGLLGLDGSSRARISTIYGGTAVNNSVTILSTTNGSPGGDSINLKADVVQVFPVPGGTGGNNSVLLVGVDDFDAGNIEVSGSFSGHVAIVAQATASGTLNLPNGPATLATTGVLVGRQTFCASGCTATGGTYTPDAGTNLVDVQCIGGGGGSGGAALTGAAQEAIGGSGGGAAYIRKRITSAFSGVTVTPGAGGTAGGAGGAGGTGGTSTFGALLTAVGGSPGVAGVAAAAGTIGTSGSGGTATPTGGDVNIAGLSSADIPYLNTTVVQQAFPGGGLFGQGGRIRTTTTTQAGTAAVAYGAGATGGINAASQASAIGGAAGGPGFCQVDEYN